MENIATLLIPALLGILLIRTILLPLGFAFKLAVHSGCGFLCLWLLNAISLFTHIAFPINGVTVLVAGFLGVPGIALLVLLEML